MQISAVVIQQFMYVGQYFLSFYCKEQALYYLLI